MGGDAGSNPAIITPANAWITAEIAQLVERSPEEPRVPGSIPGLCANLLDVHCIRTA